MEFRVPEVFSIFKEKEDYKVVRKTIEQDSVFLGTNLWILFFAILVASLGLNMNSTAVVIGAMLISPLMGPIVGIGFGVAINDLPLIKKAFRNYLFAAAVGLVASTFYFLISPIDDAHSEILSRTLPTIYDVLIALFGGFAGIIAISSKHKGNVIPGVAIATALMPPLCTAGYGLATAQFNFFLGAFYLYLINSVFIALATLITAYLMKFPKRKHDDPSVERKERIIISTVVLFTLIPSLYLGYDIVRQSRFNERATKYISAEAFFPNNYLLNKEIKPKEQKITLTFGGKEITSKQIEELKGKLKYYDLENANLEIKQGFALLEDDKSEEKLNHLATILSENELENQSLKNRLDSLATLKLTSQQLFRELKVQYPDLEESIIQPVYINSDSAINDVAIYLVLLRMSKSPDRQESAKLKKWLQVRLNQDSLQMVIQPVSKTF
ncbi:MAG TPA: TIGR00341 family protein [Bacteroidia bacterium]|nr:TIGR00341 family protein [Bacteroidia bacterium]HNS11436.1 TIGR00341 family protein [Bacteroidia bacterium]